MKRLASWLLCALLSLSLAPAIGQGTAGIKTDLSKPAATGKASVSAPRTRPASTPSAGMLTQIVSDPYADIEHILSYDIDVQVNADNTLDVTEIIRVHAAGELIRRGIYRDFPTRYKDRHGNNVVVGFEVKEVLRDGKPEPWFTESMSNGVRVNFGNDDFLPVPADYAYTLRYRTTRQVGFFPDHDELYWNAIGTGWNFIISHGSVTVRLPQPVPVADLRAEGYTGEQGAKERNFTVTLPAPGQAHWQTNSTLFMHQGLTIVLGFPKGLVTPPTARQKVAWFLSDNRAILVGLGTFALMFGYLLLRWFRVGRDPDPGVIIARYEPPAGYAPSELRYIRKMTASDRCFTADLVDMAVRGLIRISSSKGVLGSRNWTLERTETQPGSELPDVQRALLKALFRYDRTLVVTPSNREKFMGAKLALFKSLEAAYSGRMFKSNGGPVGLALVVGIAGMIAAFVISHGAGTAFLIILCIAMFALLITFSNLLYAPTPEGRKLLDEIDGLKLYLGVAEREDLARLQAPSLDAGRFESLLPYAIALDVEEAWTKKFTEAVGAAAAQQATSHMGWYSGASFASMNQFTSGIGSSFGGSIASASSPPGSSSGGGGGGSSGGGGGGGGGGGR